MKLDTELQKRFQIPVCEEIESYPFVRDEIPQIPYLFAKENQLLPLSETEEGIWVATTNPFDIEGLQALRLLMGKPICPMWASKEMIDRGIEKCYRQQDEETKKLFADLEESDISLKEVEGYDLLDKKESSPVQKIVNAIFIEAIQQGASDIHFEPTEEGILVRYRIDGVLQEKHSSFREYQSQIATRLKVMAKLDIAEMRLPQDGRIKLSHGGREIDFRMSTLPTVHGERIVLRILDRNNVELGLDRMGMDPDLLEAFRKLAHRPEGILLVTGPTGSGKTTTLYSTLAELQTKETNIVTIEDPVEYKIEGISQVHVNPQIDLTFAKGLRHILRQDPDIIMIGEIRDKETATIAIQASLTGHLVLSTLHTNDAPSALTRLADMGIEPYLLASSILAVLAQRLVRKICTHCKEAYEPSAEELKELLLVPGQILYRGRGCEHCFSSGYKGRAALYELMPLSARIKAQVLKSQDAEELRNLSLELGMIPLFRRGVELACRGITSSKEVLRVAKMESVYGLVSV